MSSVRPRVPILVLDGGSVDDPSKASGPCLRALVAAKASGVDLGEFIVVLDASNPHHRTMVPKHIRHAPAMSFPGRDNDAILSGEERGFMCLWRLVDYIADISMRVQRNFDSVGASIQSYVPSSILPVNLGGECATISVFAQMKRAKSLGALPPIPRPARAAPRAADDGEEYRSDGADQSLVRRMDLEARASDLSTISRPSAVDMIHRKDEDRLAPMDLGMEMNPVGERMLITGRSKGPERAPPKLSSSQFEELSRQREEERSMREKMLMKRLQSSKDLKPDLFYEDKRQKYDEGAHIPRVERETADQDRFISVRKSVDSGMSKKFQFA
jgi:hypothetical protein